MCIRDRGEQVAVLGIGRHDGRAHRADVHTDLAGIAVGIAERVLDRPGGLIDADGQGGICLLYTSVIWIYGHGLLFYLAD